MSGFRPVPVFDAVIDRVIARDPSARTAALPDEDVQPRRCGTWAPGSWDAAIRAHVRPREVGVRGDVIRAIVDACEDTTGTHDHAVTRAVLGLEIPLYLHSMVRTLQGLNLDSEHLSSLASRLMERALHRETVKVGIVLAGVAGLDSTIYTVRALGTHDEFAYYASIAADLGLASPARELWLVATNNSPWTTDYAVARLSKDMRTDIEAWIRSNFHDDHPV